MLKDALEARNFLMHQFFLWHAEDYITDEGRGRMLRELEQIRLRLVRAQVVFQQIRDHVFKKVYGINDVELNKLYENYLDQTNQNIANEL